MSQPIARSVEEAAGLLAARSASSVELAESVLGQIERHESQVGAFVTRVDRSAVLAEAAASDERRRAGDELGPLDGIPIGHKDNLATAGLRTTASSLVLRDWVPTEDAAVVTNLRAAGTVLVGKLKNYEFAFSAIDSQHFGRTHNPWDLDRVTGGSSSGSAAALAAGMCLGATGTDTGGSIRIPASFCGVVGLKPTFGLVGRSGVLPTSWSLDHVGPMARTVTDVGLLLDAMADPDAADPGSTLPASWSTGKQIDSLQGIKIGVERTHFSSGITADVGAAFDAAIDALVGLGAEIIEVETPSANASVDSLLAIVSPEATVAHDQYMKHHLADYGDVLRLTLLSGHMYGAVDYVRAQQVRSMLISEFDAVLDQVDAIVTPTVAFVAPRYGQEHVLIDDREMPVAETSVRFTGAANLTGHPALTVPFGASIAGMPVGIQLIGGRYDEAMLLSLGRALETVGPGLRIPSMSEPRVDSGSRDT
jgi:aspartyl-tRNA(Asn)/glutamyl-tRNA(Gln) amidotransferase subunit A